MASALGKQGTCPIAINCHGFSFPRAKALGNHAKALGCYAKTLSCYAKEGESPSFPRKRESMGYEDGHCSSHICPWLQPWDSRGASPLAINCHGFSFPRAKALGNHAKALGCYAKALSCYAKEGESPSFPRKRESIGYEDGSCSSHNCPWLQPWENRGHAPLQSIVIDSLCPGLKPWAVMPKPWAIMPKKAKAHHSRDSGNP